MTSASSQSEWQKFDEDVSNIIQAVAKRDTDSKLTTYDYGIADYDYHHSQLCLRKVREGQQEDPLYHESQGHEASSIVPGASEPLEAVQKC